MFNLQGSEIIIVLLLALVVLGPEKLPDAMRKMGQAYAELKKMSSGFQSEFRAAVDEPMREIRETANVLRDSADFTKLQDGERTEKPKSGSMANLAPGDPDDVPTDDTPTFDTLTAEGAQGPDASTESKAAPFDDDATEVPPDSVRAAHSTAPTPIPPPPLPFTGMSAPKPDEPDSDVPLGEVPDEARTEPSPGIGDDTTADVSAGEDETDETDVDAAATAPDDEADSGR